jgi:hypothetical protein
MVVAVEHAGAERGLLIVPQGEELLIAAEATTGCDGIDVQLHDGVEMGTGHQSRIASSGRRERRVTSKNLQHLILAWYENSVAYYTNLVL